MYIQQYNYIIVINKNNFMEDDIMKKTIIERLGMGQGQGTKVEVLAREEIQIGTILIDSQMSFINNNY